MEFRRAMRDESPEHRLIERHERELIPLLHRRSWFAEARDFRLLDLVTDESVVDEHVIAYANGSAETRSLVVYHDRFATTAGSIHGSGSASLGEVLGLSVDPKAFVTFRDARSGLEFVRSCGEIRSAGLRLHLDAYEGHCFWEFSEVRDSPSAPWRRLSERLEGRGIGSLADALRDTVLEPVHAALRTVLDAELAAAAAAADGSAGSARGASAAGAGAGGRDADDLEGPVTSLIDAVNQDDPRAITESPGTMRARLTRTSAMAPTLDEPVERAALITWAVLRALDGGSASIERLRVMSVVDDALRHHGLDEGAAWMAADEGRALLELPRPSGSRDDRALLARWLDSDVARAAIGVNTWDGAHWLDGDRFGSMLRLATRVDAIETGAMPDDELVARLGMAARRAGYRVDVLLAAVDPSSGPPD
jgi:hypothetical protein